MSAHAGLGLDYASVDGDNPPDLAKAKEAGLGFAIVRADYSTWADPVCKRDRDNIRAAGLTFGAYFFPVITPSSPPPEQQVATFVANAGLIKGQDLPPIIDIEYSHGIAATGRTRPENAEWLRQAIDCLTRAYDIDPMKYCSARVTDTNDSDTLAGAADAVLAGLPNWLARYVGGTRQPAQISQAVLDGTAPPPIPLCDGGTTDPDNWWLRQRQGDALQFPGFSSTIDVDMFNPMMIGARGRRVRWTQARIGAAIDGDFGPETFAKLIAFQIANGITPFGFVDLKTFCALAWYQPPHAKTP